MGGGERTSHERNQHDDVRVDQNVITALLSGIHYTVHLGDVT